MEVQVLSAARVIGVLVVLPFIFTTIRPKTAPLLISQMMSAVQGVHGGSLFAAAAIQLLFLLIYVLLIQRVLVEGVAFALSPPVRRAAAPQ